MLGGEQVCTAMMTSNNLGNYNVAAFISTDEKEEERLDYMTSSVLMEHQKHLLASLHFKARVEATLLVCIGSILIPTI